MATRLLGIASLLLAAGSLGCNQAQPAAKSQDAIKRENARELFRRGMASAAIGDLTRAEQYYVSALDAGANEKLVVERLLVVCVADDRFPGALEYAEQYLRRHPSDMEVAFAAASIHAAMGERGQAVTLLEAVLNKHPDWADAHFAMATVLREEGVELARADQHDLRYLHLAPDGQQAEVARSRLRRGNLP